MTDPLLPLLASGTRTRGWPKHAVGGRVEYHALSRLLTDDHAGDAHFAAYSVPALRRRLVTEPPAYAQIEGGVPMTVLLFDLDCAAAHRAMGGSSAVRADDAWWEGERPKIESLFLLHPGGFIFRTRGGARLVYLLPEPHVIRTGPDEHTWKRLYLGHLAMLARRFDLICDPSISDWPRLHRLPRVVRDGAPQRYETIGDPHRIGALAYDPTPADRDADLAYARQLATTLHPWRPAVRILEAPVTLTAARVQRRPRAIPARTFAPHDFLSLATDIGQELRRYSGRHGIHLALAGACYGRGVPLTVGPDLARTIASVTGETDDRPQVWATTGDRVLSGRPVAGYATLRAHWPRLADIIDTALPADGGARAARDALDAIGTPTAVAAQDAAARIRDAIEHAPVGFSLLRVTEGAGKTQAAVDVAIARARAAPATERLPSADRTLIVTDKHSVAERLIVRLHDAGVHAAYWRSVLSVRDDHGNPACEYHVPVSALARGRQSPVATFCEGIGMSSSGGNEPCAKQPVCAAYSGARMEVNAVPEQTPRVVVTVHAKLAEALAWAGESGLVLIDEDPRAVEAHTLTREQLDATARLEGSFARHEIWRTVVVRALAAGLDGAIAGETAADALSRGIGILSPVTEWHDDCERAFGTLDARQIAEAFAVRVAYRKLADGGWRRRPTWAPRLHRREHARVFHGGSLAHPVADASLVHAVLAQAFAGAMKITPDGANAHGQEAVLLVDHDAPAGTPVLRVLVSSAAVSESLRRYGQTVLLDATADTAALEAIAGHSIPATDIRVADGSPIDRRLLYWSGASRRRAIDPISGAVRWDTGFARYLREAITYVLERVPSVAAIALALFSWKPVADVLRLAWSSPDRGDPVAVSILDPVRSRGGSLHVGHYGAVRGSDDWAGCHGIVSIGDPRPNLGSSRAVAAAIGLGDEQDAVYRHATAAEASQVAGRVRAPWRASSAIHVHVGTIAPLSWDARADVVELPHGADAVIDVDRAVRVYGSMRGAARGVGLAKATVSEAMSVRRVHDDAPLRDEPCDCAPLAVGGVSLSEGNTYRATPPTANGAQLFTKPANSNHETTESVA